MAFSLKKLLVFELRAVNVLLMIMGFALQGIGLILFISDPLTSTEGFGDLVDTYKVKIAPFALGTILMLTGYVGMNFVKTRTTGAACSYFTFLVIILVCEILGLIYTIGIGNTLVIASTPSKRKSATNAEKNRIGETFFSFQKRFAFDSMKVESTKFEESGKNPHCWLEPKADGAKFKLHEQCYDNVDYKCKAEYGKHEARLKAYCVPKSEATKATYYEECNACLGKGSQGPVDSFYTLWINNMSASSKRLHPQTVDGKPADLQLWNTETGLAFCRCYGRIVGSLERHISQFICGIIIFICLQLCIIGCSSYLFGCSALRYWLHRCWQRCMTRDEYEIEYVYEYEVELVTMPDTMPPLAKS